MQVKAPKGMACNTKSGPPRRRHVAGVRLGSLDPPPAAANPMQEQLVALLSNESEPPTVLTRGATRSLPALPPCLPSGLNRRSSIQGLEPTSRQASDRRQLDNSALPARASLGPLSQRGNFSAEQSRNATGFRATSAPRRGIRPIAQAGAPAMRRVGNRVYF